ncbi:MAG TPA: arginine deiminase [Acholeplasmataceae bacterium]|nr:arginine deiminase [Acholeplasmataceae bacterium]
MSILNVFSDIGRLKKVLLHRPGKELENLTPRLLDRLLFDDIPWLELAIKEHDGFAEVLRRLGVEVLYLEDLVTETLDQNPEIKNSFIDQFIKEAKILHPQYEEIVKEYLLSFPTKDMVLKTMSGVRKNELPNFVKKTLSDYIREYPFILDPMPNLYFTRDPFAVIGNGISLNKMYTETRRREGIYGEYIFKYHPIYGNDNIPLFYNRNDKATIEGGDIIILNDEIIAVGISERTHPAGIEGLASNIFQNTNFQKILAFDIPKTRAFMHLDTVFTQVDYDKFTLHDELNREFKVFEITKNKDDLDYPKINPIHKKLVDILSENLNRKVTLIPCGGGDIIASSREQWSDGANTLAIAPGEVIVYKRNYITNEELVKHGIKIHPIPASELSRGRGGPRCMSMAFYRE